MTSRSSGTRASWGSLALAAPIASAVFLGSIAWTATNNPLAVAQPAVVTTVVAPALPAAAPVPAPEQRTTKASSWNTAVTQRVTQPAAQPAAPVEQQAVAQQPAPLTDATSGASGK